MARAAKKSSRTGIVEIKHCGFNDRPKLMAADPAGDGDSLTDVLPELFKAFEGRKVRVTIEAARP